METLQNVFPSVPVSALERVLDICDQNVETASEWILENNWRDLIEENDEGDDAVGDGEQQQQQEGGEANDRLQQELSLPQPPPPVLRIRDPDRSAGDGVTTSVNPLPTMVVSTHSNPPTTMP
uniref:CUE domain-containing protein n=1 Tax=Globisporangium ultimum (strain ATCC 200006 / CBS 805.95 / DAOM BR144) TaxID=431595 RepID=K3W566_GLOUD